MRQEKQGFLNYNQCLIICNLIVADKPLIRVGPQGDGGYLIPDDLVGIEACFSPGVSDVSGFEKELAKRGIKVFLADKSVDKPAEPDPLFQFTKKYLGLFNNDDFMTMDDWVEESLPESQSDLLLQMDIEGFEYEVLMNTSTELMNRFRIMVIEFHQLDELWNQPFYSLVSRVFLKILQTHTCVHNHPNNCCGSIAFGNLEIPCTTEITFLRKDRINNSHFSQQFPHPLDFDNTDKPPLVLPSCWYRQSSKK